MKVANLFNKLLTYSLCHTRRFLKSITKDKFWHYRIKIPECDCTKICHSWLCSLYNFSIHIREASQQMRWNNGFVINTASSTMCTHSLTHCCAWPAEGRSVLHIERSWPAIQAAPTDRPTSSSTCCSQEDVAQCADQVYVLSAIDGIWENISFA